jgi:hypothetical protein
MNTVAAAILSISLSVAAQFTLKAGMSTAAVREVLAGPFTLRAGLTVLTNWFVVGGSCFMG